MSFKTCNLDVSCRAYKDGPIIPVELTGVPIDENEAIKMGLGRVMYDGWIRSLAIAKQNKARLSHKSPTNGSRTKTGSAVSQAAAARAKAMREAAEQARVEAETETEDQAVNS